GVRLLLPELLGGPHLAGNVFGHQQEADGPARGIAARRDHDPGIEARAVLPDALDDPLPFTMVESRLKDVGWDTLGHIVGRMEHIGVDPTDDFAGLVAVEAASALVPQDDAPVQILA